MRSRLMTAALGGLLLIAVPAATLAASRPAGPTPRAADPTPACGTVTSNRTLTSDCAGPLVIAANNVTVDLNGKRVSCGGRADRTGVIIEGRTKVTLKNGTVRACGVGVRIGGGSQNTLSNLTVQGNFFYGIVLDATTRNTVLGGQVTSNGSEDATLYPCPDPVQPTTCPRGIVLRNTSTLNTLHGVRLANNIGYAVELKGSHSNTLRNLTVTSNTRGGIALDFGSNGNRVKDSTLNGNVRFGIYLFGEWNTISGNTVTRHRSTGYGIGIQLTDQGDHNSVWGNHADLNEVGIRVGGNENSIAGNDADGNLRDGITAGVNETQATAAGNEYEDNTASGNRLYDLADYTAGACTANEWDGNGGTKLYDGCEDD